MAVQKLADALASGQPDVVERDVVNSIGQPWLRGETLEQNFRSGTGSLQLGANWLCPARKRVPIASRRSLRRL